MRDIFNTKKIVLNIDAVKSVYVEQGYELLLLHKYMTYPLTDCNSFLEERCLIKN